MIHSLTRTSTPLSNKRNEEALSSIPFMRLEWAAPAVGGSARIWHRLVWI
jgi:hypothetical protein